MDGACKSACTLIEDAHPHVQCYIYPTHSIDNFMENVCAGADSDTITIRGQG
jgi:hypothetical protein